MSENIPNPPRLLDRSSAIKLHDTVVITDVVGTDIFTITNPASSPDGTVPAGQPEGYPILLADKRPLESLFDMYMTLGPGDHSLDGVKRVYAQTRTDILPSIFEETTELDALMPDTVFKLLVARDELVWSTHKTAIHIGNITIAARRPTKDEVAQAKHREMQKKREELDKDKLRYTDYDHAVITVGDRRFFLPTDRANTILAARIIHFLANATPNWPQAHAKASKSYFDGQEVVNGVWDAMHTDERLMFTKKDEDAFDVFKVKGKSLPIGSYVVSILEQLTNQLGITRQTTGGRFQLENKPSIAFSAAPPAENEDWTTLTPVFAPGTPREHIIRTMTDIPNEAFVSADMLLDNMVSSTEPLDHPTAIRVLDLIIDRDIKRAIRSRLGGDNRRLAETLDALSERVRQSLGESFPIAYRDRLIGGHSAHGAHGGVRQITGRLPITTQPPVNIITRWRVGMQSR